MTLPAKLCNPFVFNVPTILFMSYQRPIFRAVLVLDLLNKANCMRNNCIPVEKFYNRILSRRKKLMNFFEDFKNYVKNKDKQTSKLTDSQTRAELLKL